MHHGAWNAPYADGFTFLIPARPAWEKSMSKVNILVASVLLLFAAASQCVGWAKRSVPNKRRYQY